MLLKLIALFVATEAARIAEFTDEADEAGPQGPVLELVPGGEFESMKHPVLSHQLEVESGNLVLEIQETGSGLKANGYDVFLVQKNGKALKKHLQVGKLAVKAPGLFSTRSKYVFRSTNGKNLLRMYLPFASVGRRTVHVTSDVSKNPYA